MNDGTPCSPCSRVGEARDEALRRFSAGAAATATSAMLAEALDACLVHAVDPRPGVPWALLALGSYGRGELSFASDVDCLVLHRGPEPDDTLAAVTHAVRDLWSRGVRTAVAVYDLRRAASLARSDDKVLATLLDRRFLCGDRDLARRLDEAMDQLATRGRVRRFARFLADEDRRRTGQVGLDLHAAEPDLKLCLGGLRDLASVRWLATLGRGLRDRGRLADPAHGRMGAALAAVEQSREAVVAARDALLTARHLLGGVLGTRRERLGREAVHNLRSTDAARVHLPGLDRHLATGRGDVAMLRGWMIEVLADPAGRPARPFPGYVVAAGRLRPAPGTPDPSPAQALRLAAAAAERGWTLDTGLACRLRLAGPAAPELGPALIDVLATPHGAAALPWVLEAGLLPAALPAIRRAVGLVPGDEVHAYTVERHGVKVAEEAAALLDGRASLPADTVEALAAGHRHRAVLLLACLLHDAGKASGPPHAEHSARLAMASARALELREADGALAADLCGEHMRMPQVSVGRDCDDPAVLDGLAEAFGTAERLDLLYLLAVADLRALGPDRAGSFREGLLARAWRGTRERMSAGLGQDALRRRLDARREALAACVVASGLPRPLAVLARSLPDRFVGAFHEAALWQHLLLLHESRPGEARVALSPAGPRNAWEVTFVGADEPGLLSRICGALFLEGLSIQEARIFSLPGDRVLDQFRVVDAGERALATPEARDAVGAAVARAAHDQGIPDRVRRRMGTTLRDGTRRVRLLAEVDNTASAGHTTFRVTGPDAPGLLHRVADLLYRHGVNVTHAVVTTVGGTAVDTFFGEWARGGGKVTDPETIRGVLRELADLQET